MVKAAEKRHRSQKFQTVEEDRVTISRSHLSTRKLSWPFKRINTETLLVPAHAKHVELRAAGEPQAVVD
jgi:hypothetical protein